MTKMATTMHAVTCLNPYYIWLLNTPLSDWQLSVQTWHKLLRSNSRRCRSNQIESFSRL